MARSIVAVAVVCAFSVVADSHAQCPSYTNKDSADVRIGTPSSLPEGWCVYAKPGTNGVFRSNVRTFSEALVSGTSSHSPTCIEISPDGGWLVYMDSRTSNIYVVPSTGGTARSVPVDLMVPHAVFGPHFTGFRRGLASGLEVYYNALVWQDPGRYQDTSLMITTPVTFSGSSPVFGSPKLIANMPTTKIYGGSGTFAVWKDQIFGIFHWAPNGYTMNGFLTVPGDGNGVATDANLYRFSDSPTESYWGCGQTMSHDGLYCASNSRNIGDPNCVPNQESDPTYDHKGIYITKFLRQGVDPAIPIDDQIMNPAYGRSINWCPMPYRRGTYSDCEFTNWNFSNHNEYLAGISQGTRIATYGLSYGVWVLHWPTNTWTQITPATTTIRYDEPALHFTGAIGVAPRPAGAVRPGLLRTAQLSCAAGLTLPAGATGYALYDLEGRCLLAVSFAAATSHETQIVPPPQVRGQPLVVRFSR